MRKGFFPRLALSGIRKNRSIYYPYILTAVLTTAMMYIMGSLQNVTTDYSGTLAFSLQLGIVVTSVFSVIFLFYTNSFLMRRRKKEFGLYNILGMEKRHLTRLILWETVLMLLISLLLGLAVGILLDKLMHLLLSHLVGQAVSLTFAVSPGAMRYTALLISVTFALILLNSVRQVYFARPVELLRSAEVGEREPKARWFIALLGLIALGTGYWLSATVKDAGAMILFFFVAVLLVIAGTYLLFTAGSVTLLKALRKNRRYYYKPDHFISVSGMIYRMRQNAVGLANVCVLCTMVLVMVFSTLSLWLGMEDTLNSRLRVRISTCGPPNHGRRPRWRPPWMRRSAAGGRLARGHQDLPLPLLLGPARPGRLRHAALPSPKATCPHCQPRHLPGPGRWRTTTACWAEARPSRPAKRCWNAPEAALKAIPCACWMKPLPSKSASPTAWGPGRRWPASTITTALWSTAWTPSAVWTGSSRRSTAICPRRSPPR